MRSNLWQYWEEAPREVRSYYEAWQVELERLQAAGNISGMELANAAWIRSTEALSWLRTYWAEHDAVSDTEEVFFFKMVKPAFQEHCLYWREVFDGLLHLPIGPTKRWKQYVDHQLQRLSEVREKYHSFFEYVRQGRTDRDLGYFTRGRVDTYELLDPLVGDRDSSWATGYDYLVAVYRSLERLAQFWKGLRNNSATNQLPSAETKSFPLRWTASKAALVELVYALQSSGVYNEGQVELKQLVTLFGQYFQVDLGNFYHIFNEIRLRKKSRTQLLDFMKERVIAKMDEMDLK